MTETPGLKALPAYFLPHCNQDARTVMSSSKKAVKASSLQADAIKLGNVYLRMAVKIIWRYKVKKRSIDKSLGGIFMTTAFFFFFLFYIPAT